MLKSNKISAGEEILFSGDVDDRKREGTNYFHNNDFANAKKLFNQARSYDDPENEIYYNNSLAQEDSNYFSFIVPIPVKFREEIARETLKGVAQAQRDFNRQNRGKSPLLNIIIADDDNDGKQAEKLAKEFIKDKNILGVIGHIGSNVSEAVIGQYSKANLAMISPSSSSTALKGQKKFL
ncbi:MAG: hypothetical protein HC908_09160 [Calothrix sp. SM1_7_51]|nr:hypothetical protein [Calothrix sp. SM1_7_51]